MVQPSLQYCGQPRRFFLQPSLCLALLVCCRFEWSKSTWGVCGSVRGLIRWCWPLRSSHHVGMLIVFVTPSIPIVGVWIIHILWKIPVQQLKLGENRHKNSHVRREQSPCESVEQLTGSIWPEQDRLNSSCPFKYGSGNILDVFTLFKEVRTRRETWQTQIWILPQSASQNTLELGVCKQEVVMCCSQEGGSRSARRRKHAGAS